MKKSLVQVALLAAIIIVMSFTPLGYLKLGPIEITLLVIPVAIGAIVIGPGAGALLGLVFGMTSFAQCFGSSIFGSQLLAISPLSTAILCIVPRVLVGLLCGLSFRCLRKFKLASALKYALASFSCALLNTVFFVGVFVALFSRTEFFTTLQGGMSLLAFLATFIGVNGIVEAIAATVIGATLCRALESAGFVSDISLKS